MSKWELNGSLRFCKSAGEEGGGKSQMKKHSSCKDKNFPINFLEKTFSFFQKLNFVSDDTSHHHRAFKITLLEVMCLITWAMIHEKHTTRSWISDDTRGIDAIKDSYIFLGHGSSYRLQFRCVCNSTCEYFYHHSFENFGFKNEYLWSWRKTRSRVL